MKDLSKSFKFTKVTKSAWVYLVYQVYLSLSGPYIDRSQMIYLRRCFC